MFLEHDGGATVVVVGDDVDVLAMLSNPFYAIEIDPGLAVPHQPLVSEDQWIAANIQLIKELGPESYLRNLLSILKGNETKPN